MSDADLSPEERSRVQRQLQALDSQMKVFRVMLQLVDTCFDRCVQKPGDKLAAGEIHCLSNCANRFFDVTAFLANRMSKE